MNRLFLRFVLWLSVRKARKITAAAESRSSGDALDRPVEFSAGDYAVQNAYLIAVIESSQEPAANLWHQEARDSINPDRFREAMEISRAFRDIIALQRAFYSRWDIEK